MSPRAHPRASSPRPLSPRRAASPAPSTPRDDGLTIDDALYDALTTRAGPLPSGRGAAGQWRRQPPSRRLLLESYHATHGAGSLLSQRSAGVVTLESRAKVCVELWRKLTGDEHTPAASILSDAQAAQRKNAMVATPSPAFKAWLNAPPAAAHAGFGSSSEQRAHPGLRPGLRDDSALSGPGVGSYDPAAALDALASKASKGSSWHRKSTASRLKSQAADGDGDEERKLPWDVAEENVAPAASFYHTSHLNMARQLQKDAGRVSPGMARPASPSARVQATRAARSPSARGPGAYDVGGFNMSRKVMDKRPSSAFASKAKRESPFGGGQAGGGQGGGAVPLVAKWNALDAPP